MPVLQIRQEARLPTQRSSTHQAIVLSYADSQCSSGSVYQKWGQRGQRGQRGLTPLTPLRVSFLYGGDQATQQRESGIRGRHVFRLFEGLAIRSSRLARLLSGAVRRKRLFEGPDADARTPAMEYFQSAFAAWKRSAN